MMISSSLRVLIRSIWGTIRLWIIQLETIIWGSAAFERAVYHAPPWLALKLLRAQQITIGHGIDFHGRLNLHGSYHPTGKLHIGEWCHIGPQVTLDLTDHIRIEDRVTISLNTQILTHMDVGYSPLRETHYPSQHAPVHIEHGAYIGAGATILMGVTIGANSVVAAGAVVTDNVPADTVVGGIPAKPIKSLR
ncbi:MAG: acyltransferase [Anaerolineae bacterium]